MTYGLEANQLAALAIGAVACVCDWRSRRVPNLVTFGGAALAAAWALANHGVGGLFTALAGWGLGLAIFLPMFLLGGMGAGDVKLLACLGAWLGPQGTFWTAMAAMIAGGVMGVGVALATGYARQALRNLWLLLQYWSVMGVRPLPELTLATARGPRLPYAIPIAVGAAATIWMR